MVKGLDLSFSKASRQWWEARFGEGHRVMCQGLWTGGAGTSAPLATVAPHNIQEAHARGFECHGYTNVSPWHADPVAAAKGIAGSTWPLIAMLWVDVEIDGVTEAMIQDACNKAKAEKSRVGIYSARWFWQGRLGNPKWPWLLEYPLWVADYDDDPDLSTAALFGPWPAAYAKQYTNTTNVDGVNIDFDTFTLEDDMNVAELEAYIKQKAAESYTFQKGDLIQGDGDQEVYYIELNSSGNPTRRHVNNPAAAAYYGLDLTKIKVVSLLTVLAIPQGERLA